MKRWICLMLSLLFFCAAPSAAAAAAPSGARADSWEALEAIEAQAAPQSAFQSEAALTAAYAARGDEMVRAVQDAADYVPGSMDRHGDFFFWQTADGRANGYAPSLRAALRIGQRNAADCPESPVLPAAAADSGNIPGNRDVGIFMSYPGSWYFHPELCEADGQKLADSTGGQLLAWMGEDASVDGLAEALGRCGILLINTHGRTDYEAGDDHSSRANTSYICLPTDRGITAADQVQVTGPYGTYRHAFDAGPNEDGTEHYYCVDGTCIRNHMTREAPHSAVYLGCCLGMATEGLFSPLRAAGAEVLLGFSERVITNTDHDYRAVLCEALSRGADFGEAVAAMKEQVGCPDPIDVGHPPAWPIAVSSQDPYPGRDHLTEGQTVLSDWELYPAYPIDVTVEPAGSAEARVTRTYVDVTPADGFLFTDWELTAGEAAAERNGNELHFLPAGPIAITIHMTARNPSTLRFSAGPGQSCETICAYEDDEILLPAPTGELEADAFICHFLGWSLQPLAEDTTERPALLAPGDRWRLPAGNTELHAVYGYFAPEDEAEAGQFRLLTEAPGNWAGDWVLTYQSTKALRASEQITGQAVASPSAAAAADGDYFVDGDWLNEVSDRLIWTAIPCAGGGYLLKMKTSENYLAVPSASVMLSTAGDPEAPGTQWKLQWTDGSPIITNKRFSSRILQYSTGSSAFCTLSTLRFPLMLYRSVPGEHFYTTQPRSTQGGQDPEPPFRFADVSDPSAYYYEAVYWAASHRPRITAGTSSSTFSPTAVCSRAQILAFLYNSLGRPSAEHTENPFSDLADDAYYRDAVLWASKNGVTRGTGNGKFSPDAPCTRAQIVTFLYNVYGK